MKRGYEMDMCTGPLFRKLLVFSVPLMLSGILQLLFNAADIIVVGRFTGSQALAAVGSTSSLIALFVNFFIGLSIGTNVLVAQYYGAKEQRHVHETVHTSILSSIIIGVILIVIGLVFAVPILEIMGTPADVLDQATLYLRIYFIGMPSVMVYNFGAAVLKAIGDTRRPLYYLLTAGIINVVLNLFFVIVFHMGVAGVALATIISQTVSAILIVRCLMATEGMCQLVLKDLKIHKSKLIGMFRIGLPAGFQSAVFSISNVLIQSSVNSFGSLAMAGNTAGSNLEGFAYTAMNAVYQANLSFTSQNVGAGQYKRINQILWRCVTIVIGVGVFVGAIMLVFSRQLLGIYTTDPQVIAYGILRMNIIFPVYFSCGLMDVLVGSMRGMGYSVVPMIVSLLGACGFRIVWIFTVFATYHSLEVLYISYPISWFMTAAVHFICYLVIKKKVHRKFIEAAARKQMAAAGKEQAV